MKKLLALLLVSSTFVLVFVPGVFADSSALNVSVDYSDHSVHILGSSGVAYRYVSLQVVNPGMTFEDFQTKDDVINWSAQGKTATDGSFEFSYHITGETGLYTVIAGVDGEDEKYQTTFNYFAPTEVDNTLSEIIGYTENKDAGGIKSVIENKADMLQIDVTDYSALPEYNKDLICKGIAEEKIVTMNDFKELFEAGVEVQKINLITDSDDYYEKVKEFLGKKYDSAYTVMKSLSKSESDAVISAMMQTDYKTKTGLADDLTGKALLTKIKKIKLWGEMEKFLKDTKDLTGIDFSDYDELTDKSAAIKKMLDISYESLGQIKKEFDSAVEYAKNEKQGSSSSGGSGSSGGKQSSKYTAYIPSSGNSEETGGSAIVFVDLNEAAWAEECVSALYAKKIISGDGRGFFRPNDNITRAEFLKMLVMRYNLVVSGKEKKQFDDISETDWYFGYVRAALDNGIVNGISETEFNPDGLISRQDMAAMIYRAEKFSGHSFEAADIAFNDMNDVSDYAKEAVASLYKAGIVNGYNNRFEPLGTATRAQAAQIVYNTYNR